MNITYQQTYLHHIVTAENELNASGTDKEASFTISGRGDTKAEAIQNALESLKALAEGCKEMQERVAAL